MPRPQDLGGVEGHGAEQCAARHRPQDARGDDGAKGALDQRRRPHRPDADRGRNEAEPDQDPVVKKVEDRRVGRLDDVRRADDRLGDQHRRQRCGEDRHGVGESIGADDELERVKGAGQRRAERRGDRAARPAADQHAQILPAQTQIEPQP